MNQNTEVGTITVKANLDTEGFPAGSKRMKDAANSAKDAVVRANKEMSDSLTGYVNTVAAAEKSTREIARNVSEVSGSEKELSAMADKADDIASAEEKVANAADDAQQSIEDWYESMLKAAAASSEDSFDAPVFEYDDIEEQVDGFEALNDVVEDLTEKEARYLELLKQGSSISETEINERRRAGISYDGFGDEEKSTEAIKEAVAEEKELKEEVKEVSDASKPFTGEVERQKEKIDQLNTDLKQTKSSLDETTSTNSVSVFGERLKQAFESAASSAKRFFSLKPVFKPGEYQKQIALIDKTENEIAKLQERQDQMKESGVKETSTQWITLKNKIESASRALAEQKYELNQMKAAGANMPFYDKWYQMSTLSGTVIQALQGIGNAAKAAFFAIQHPAQLIDRAFASVISKAAQLGTTLAKMAGNAAVSFLKRLAVDAKNAAIQLVKLAGNAISSGIQKLGTGIKTLATGVKNLAGHAVNAAKSLLSLGKSAKRSGGGFNTSFKTILKYVFGVRSMFFLVKRLRGAITDALGNMAKIDKPTNKALSSMTSALNQVKNSLGSAFQPIVTAVAPYVTQLLNMLSSAMTKIAEFFAVLTGQKYVLQATAVQTDYAASLDKTTNASRRATKEAKNQLAAFDHLNILSGNDPNGSDTSSSATDPSRMFKQVPVASYITDFMRELRAAFEAGDFFGVGTILAGKLNAELAKLKKLISWDNVGDTVKKGVDAIVGVINGLIDPKKGINFDLVGSTISEGINTVLKAFGLLADGIDWKNIGLAIASGLNGLFRDFNWEFAGELLGKRINIITDVFTNAFANFKWESLGSYIAIGLIKVKDTVKWTAIGEMFGNAFNGILTTIRTFAEKFEWEDAGKKFGSAVEALRKEVDWFGLGDTLYAMMWGAVSYIRGAIRDFSLADLGTDFANTINQFFAKDELWADAGETIDTAIKNLLNFTKNFVVKLNTTVAALRIRTALENIDWTGIASSVWDTIKAAFKQAGNFVNVLLGGGVDYTTIKDSASKIEAIQSRSLTGSNESLAQSIGKNLAGVLNKVLGQKSLFTEVGKTFNQTLLDTLKFGQAFIEGFNATQAADDVKAALGEIKWQQIATEAWATIKKFFAKAGSFVDALFTEDIDYTRMQIDPAYAKKVADYNSKSLGGRMGQKLAEAISKGISALPAGEIGEALTTALKTAIEFGQMLLETFDAPGFADKAVKVLRGVDWAAIGEGTIKLFATGIWKAVQSGALLVLKTVLPDTMAEALEAEMTKSNFVAEIYGNIRDAIEQNEGGVKHAFDESMDYIFSASNMREDKAYEYDRFYVGLKNIIRDETGKIRPQFQESMNAIFSPDEIALFESGKMTTDQFLTAVSTSAINGEGIVSDAFKSILTLATQKTSELATESGATISDNLFSSYILQSLLNQPDAESAVQGTFNEIWSALDANGQGEIIALDYFNSFMGVARDSSGNFTPEFKAIIESMFGSVEAFEQSGATAKEFLEGLVQGMWDSSGTTSINIARVVDWLFSDTDSKLVLRAEDQGENYINALSTGAENGKEQAKKGLGAAVNYLLEYVEDKELEQGSPSKRAMRSGKWYMQGFAEGVEDEQSNTQSVVSNAFDDIADVSLAMASMKYIITEELNNIKSLFDVKTYQFNKAVKDMLETMKTDMSSGMLAMKTTVSTQLASIAILNLEKLMGMRNDLISTLTSSNTELSTGFNTAQATVLRSMSSIATTMSSNLWSVQNTVSSRFGEIHNSIVNNLNNAMHSANNIHWSSVGTNIIYGIADGINRGWNWLNRTVYNLANSLFRTARNALGIHSPSKLFREEVGMMIGLGMAEGIEDSESSIMDSMVSVADAIADGMPMADAEMEMDVSGAGLLDGLDGVLTNFSGMVSNSFAELVSTLNDIVNSTSFRIPVYATGTVMPYSVSAQSASESETVSDAITASNDDLANVVMQAVNNATSAIVDAIQRSGVANTTATQTVDDVINEINRRAKAQGHSPIII